MKQIRFIHIDVYLDSTVYVVCEVGSSEVIFDLNTISKCIVEIMVLYETICIESNTTVSINLIVLIGDDGCGVR